MWITFFGRVMIAIEHGHDDWRNDRGERRTTCNRVRALRAVCTLWQHINPYISKASYHSSGKEMD
jgi:hypothetical protein